jgi:hypothetical protein
MPARSRITERGTMRSRGMQGMTASTQLKKYEVPCRPSGPCGWVVSTHQKVAVAFADGVGHPVVAAGFIGTKAKQAAAIEGKKKTGAENPVRRETREASCEAIKRRRTEATSVDRGTSLRQEAGLRIRRRERTPWPAFLGRKCIFNVPPPETNVKSGANYLCITLTLSLIVYTFIFMGIVFVSFCNTQYNMTHAGPPASRYVSPLRNGECEPHRVATSQP